MNGVVAAGDIHMLNKNREVETVDEDSKMTGGQM